MFTGHVGAIPLPPITTEQLINFIYAVYYFIRNLIMMLLNETIFKGHPAYAASYGDAITLLVSLTALYMILELVSAGKRIIKAILILGWIFLVIAILVSYLIK